MEHPPKQTYFNFQQNVSRLLRKEFLSEFSLMLNPTSPNPRNSGDLDFAT